MREIKFRAWDKRFKKMDFGAGALLLRINEQDFSEPMQFTGLKDKNGKEIYEGDIIRWQEWLNRSLADGKVGQIWWNRNGKWVIKENYIDMEVGIYSQIEIIGNIYENPELVSGKPLEAAA